MITDEMIAGVQSRARVLSKEFYFLDEEDLCQEGIALLLTLEKRNLPEPRVFKAINNLFSNIMEKAILRKKYEVNSNSIMDGGLDSEDQSESPEDRVIREEITDKMMDGLSGREKYIIEALVDKRNLDEIAAELGTSRNNIRRLVNKIINRRKELEQV